MRPPDDGCCGLSAAAGGDTHGALLRRVRIFSARVLSLPLSDGSDEHGTAIGSGKPAETKNSGLQRPPERAIKEELCTAAGLFNRSLWENFIFLLYMKKRILGIWNTCLKKGSGRLPLSLDKGINFSCIF